MHPVAPPRVLELEDGDAALRERANEATVWQIILHISRGLAHIHGNNILHCDIKPENILISADGAFKIGDLGLATLRDKWDEQEGDSRYLSVTHHLTRRRPRPRPPCHMRTLPY